MVYPIYNGKRPFCFSRFQQERRTVSSEVFECLRQIPPQQADLKWMLSILNHSLRIQRDLHLINSSWKCIGRGVTKSHLFVKNWLSLITVFSSSSCKVNDVISFLDSNEVSLSMNAISTNGDFTGLCK